MTFTALPDPDAEIRERHRRGQSPEQLVKVGERTGWWTSDDVDRALDDSLRLAKLQDEPAERHVIEPAEAESDTPAAGGLVGPPADAAPDLLAVGREHPDRRVRAAARAVEVAVDALCAALKRVS